VIRQLLTESLMLAALGGVAGLAAAYGLLDLLARVRGDSTLLQSEIDFTPDLRVALFAFLASALAGAGFGLLPALAATRADLATALKASMGTRRSRYRRFGLRNLFVVRQPAGGHHLPAFDPEGFPAGLAVGHHRPRSRADSCGWRHHPARTGIDRPQFDHV
jgi:hypothetical protein